MKSTHIFVLALLFVVALLMRTYGLQATAIGTQSQSNYTFFLRQNATFPEHHLHQLSIAVFSLKPYGPFILKLLLTFTAMASLYGFSSLLFNSIWQRYLSLFLFSVSELAAYYGYFGWWSGEALTPILFFFSAYLLVYARTKKPHAGPFLTIVSFAIMLFCVWVWNGGLYWLAAYMVLLFLLAFPTWYAVLAILIITPIAINSLGIILQISASPHIGLADHVWFLLTVFFNFYLPFKNALFASAYMLFSLVLITVPAILSIFSFKADSMQKKVLIPIAGTITLGLPFIIISSSGWWSSLIYLPVLLIVPYGYMTVNRSLSYVWKFLTAYRKNKGKIVPKTNPEA